MGYKANKLLKDPRNVARDIPGLFNVIFPQLTPGVIAYFNKRSTSFNNLNYISDKDVLSSSLNQAMLFELAYARAEYILTGIIEPNWEDCLKSAISKQRYYFDASSPKNLTDIDKRIADMVSNNLVESLNQIQKNYLPHKLIMSPKISGFQWIQSGNADFSLGKNLIEIKCTRVHFSSADYRQVLMYWLLSYASAIENHTNEWEQIIFINPRKNHYLQISYDELLEVSGAGKSKVEILELFASMVGDIALKTLAEFKI